MAGFIPADDKNFQYTGRIDFSNKKAPEFSWAGTSIRTKFTGTSLKVKFNEKGAGMYYVFIDGNYDNGHLITCDKGEKTYEVATGLEDKTHDLLIYKRTDGGKATTAFLGLVLDDGAKLEAPGPRPKLRMEVYGDSISTGLGCDRKRGKEHSREATDNFFSYGSITARNIGAEFRCISKSGIGLIKSWWPTIMPQYYDRACATSLEGAGEAWDFSQWQVDLVVINIFQNDSWTRKNTTSEEGVSAYIGFVKKLRGHYPESRIVCVLGSMDASKGKWAGFVKQAVQNLKEGGDKEVHSYIFRKQTGYRHPNRDDHERMAEELTAFIKTLGEIKPDPRVEAGTGYQEAYETAVAKAAGKDYHASLLLHAAALRKYGSEAAPSRLKIAEFKKDALAVKAVEMREFMIKAQDDYRRGTLTKSQFRAGLEKIAAAVPGTRTAAIAQEAASKL
jgi:hypothetical protein